MKGKIPTHYTTREGGQWLSWEKEWGRVPLEFLDTKRSATDLLFSWAPGHAVVLHALRFYRGQEWDCINGWRKKPPSRSSPRVRSVRVTRYQTLDNKQFETLFEARKHDVLQRIMELTDNGGFYTNEKEQVMNFLVAEAESLSILLRDYANLQKTIIERSHKQ